MLHNQRENINMDAVSIWKTKLTYLFMCYRYTTKLESTYRGLVFSFNEANRNLLCVIQTGYAFIIRRRLHVLVVTFFIDLLFLGFRNGSSITAWKHHLDVLDWALVRIAGDTCTAIFRRTVSNSCQTVISCSTTLLTAAFIFANQLSHILERQLGLCLRYVSLTLGFGKIINGLEFANWSFWEVLALRNGVFGESLWLLCLILTLVKLSIFQKFAPMTCCKLFGTTLVALAGQLLRWLIVLSTYFTSDSHIIVICSMVSRVWVIW